jgi:hypothetical protein
VDFGVFGPRNIDILFFMLGWARCGFHKKRAGTRYAKLVCLHLVGSTSHVVHSGASECEISMHYFSCLGGGPSAASIKKRTGTHYSELMFL